MGIFLSSLSVKEDSMQPYKRLVLVSNRLPFQVLNNGGKREVKESDGGLVSALKSYFENTNDVSFDSVLWVGSAEFSEKTWAKVKATTSTSMHYDVDPIFIDKKTYNKYYNGFCNATLWPLFHYFPSFVDFDNETFQSYEEVNRIFADKILSLLQPGDIVWVHDYQLMLLPGMIRRQVSEATIGFFLHIPFPSYEVFRMLHKPWKEKIMDGLLGADVVGFHTHEYVQHFLKSVQMTCGWDHKFRDILTLDRVVKAEMFPLGIDFHKFNTAIAEPGVISAAASIRENFAGKKIVFSVDRLDYTKGITHRLQGFERFLELNPEWLEKVVFVQVVVPSRQIISKYTERKKMIEEEIGRINGMYSNLSWQPIIYRYSQLSFLELTSLYSAADVGLITPLRDGMNLVAKEFIACKSKEGVLVLSELAGASSEMGEAILVNPMDRDDVGCAILNALNMPSEVQQQKIERLQTRLRQYSVTAWMNDFLQQLKETKSIQQMRETNNLSEASYLKLINDFSTAGSRLLLLDYDGTLVPFARNPMAALPDERVVKLLRGLSEDTRNKVVIISGRDGESLDRWFGSLPITLVAEHGAGIRDSQGSWSYELDIDQSWKHILKPVLEVYSQRTPGAFVEEKHYTLVWHYRNVEAELGSIRSRELIDTLQNMTRNSQLHVMDGNKVIEIRVAGIDKGTVAKRIVDTQNFDFVLAVGDDKTDEDMFRLIQGRGYTIKVGADKTAAQFSVTNQQEVLKLLSVLSKTSEPVSSMSK
jgi:trehalose 6-phosphate synthase/phosphatase